MKKIFTLVSIIFTLTSFSPVFAKGLSWGFVDGARLIQNHPLMRQFDPATRRFRDTLSQPRPSENATEYTNRLQKKLMVMENTIRQLDMNYADKIRGSGMAARKAYMLYWKKRESLRFYAELLKEAIAQASTHGNFYLNMPSDWTLVPVVKGISSTVTSVCEYLRQKNDLLAVLDSSVFELNDQNSAGASVGLNQHWAIWRGDQKAMKQLYPICSQLMYSIRSSFPDRAKKPFVAGAVNLNSKANEMLRSISLPSASVPDYQE